MPTQSRGWCSPGFPSRIDRPLIRTACAGNASARSFMNFSRRHFVPLAAGAFAAAALPRKGWAARSLPVGIQLYTVNADMVKDPAGTLKKIAQIGYTEVETAGWGKLSATEFRDLLRAAGLRAPSAHLNFGREETPKLLDDAKAVGADYAVSSV